MAPSKGWALLLVFLVGLALSMARPAELGAFEGQTPGEETPIFLESIDVRAVDVEVVVKKGGQTITGLGAEDFRVSLDGEELAIEDFAEIREGITGVESVRTRYLIFIDDDFSIPSRRNTVLRGLEEQLDVLGEDDRMAVVAWDGRRVELLSSWQEAGDGLRQTLEQARERPAYGLKRHSEWGRLQSALSYRDRLPGSGRSFSSIGFSGASRPGPIGPRSGAQLRARVGQLSSALASAMRGFAQPPGRRVVLFMSGALPPLEGESGYVEGRFDRLDRLSQSLEARRYFTPAVSTANRLGYTIYPVDLGGVESGKGVSAEVSSIFEADRRRELAREDDFLSEDPLLFMAESTGGLALLDSARFHALEKVAADTRSYYRIGVTPEWRGDDAEQRLEVEWLGARGRVEVRARRGFLDLSPSARVTMAVESAHLFDLPLPDEGRFTADIGTIQIESRSRIQVPLTLRFPTADLVFLDGGEGREARLELRIAANDDRGEMAEIPVVSMVVPWDEVEDGHFTWQTTLELRRRSHRILLAIHDPLGDKVLAQRLEINPDGEIDPSKRRSRR